ncbi:MAG: reverse transcriptase domain-containing protein [Alphaproteobacteria bacterium]
MLPLDLALAWRRTKADLQSRRVFVETPYEIELVEENLEEWLEQLNQKIAAGYRPTSALIADVPKGNGAIRPGATLSLEDRTVYAAAVGALLPAIHSGLRWSQGRIDFSYQLSSNPNRVAWFTNIFAGWARFRKLQLDRIKEEERSYVVFTDLTGFYENIDLEMLTSDLRNLGCDVGTVQLLRTCLYRWATIPGRGIPQGYSASDVLAKVYLNPLDRAMIDERFDYIRYVDDMRVFCPSFTNCKSALMFLTQVLRRKGLNLQTAKTEMLRREDARRQIEGIAPLLEAVQERYKKQIAEIVGSIDPYAPISEIEITVDPEQAPVEILLDVFARQFEDKDARFSTSLFHFLLKRLAAQKEAAVLDYCLGQMYIRPQETQPILDYIRLVNGFENAYPVIEKFLDSADAIYDYQKFQIFRWLDTAELIPTDRLLAIARQLTFDLSRPSYLRAVCRKLLQEHGTIADFDRLERGYADAHDDLDAAQVLISLKRMEAGRRNAFYGRVADDGLLRSRAARLVKQNRL